MIIEKRQKALMASYHIVLIETSHKLEDKKYDF